jgi:phytoene synthase
VTAGRTGSPRALASAAGDAAACRAILRAGSRSFRIASLLLPSRLRAPAAAVYAFCREADDAIDDADGALLLRTAAGEALLRAHLERQLERLALRLDGAYAGRPLPSPVDRALAAVVASFPLPRALFDALLEGFAWDA